MKTNGSLLPLIMVALRCVICVSENISHVQLFYGREVTREGVVQKVNRRKFLGKSINIEQVIVNLRNFSEVIVRKALVLNSSVHSEAITLLNDIKQYNENMARLYSCRKPYRNKVKEVVKEMDANREPRYLKLFRYMFPVEVNNSYADILAQRIDLTGHEIRKLVKKLVKTFVIRKKLNTITKNPDRFHIEQIILGKINN